MFFNTTQKILKRNPSVCMCFGGVVCFFLLVCEELCFCCCLTRCSKQNLNWLLLYKYCLFSCDNRQRAGVCRCRTLSRVVVVVFVSCSLCCRCASSTSCRLLESFGSHSLLHSLLHDQILWRSIQESTFQSARCTPPPPRQRPTTRPIFASNI